MAKNKTLEAARKAYNKSTATKYRNTGNKKTKKKEQKVKSHYGGVSKKAQDTVENRAEARAKTGSVAKSVGSNVVRKKTTNTSVSTGDNKQNGRRSGAITPVSSKQKERQVGASTARSTAKSVGKTVTKATNLHKAKTEVTDVTQGTARGTAAGSAFNKGKAAEKALEKAGEKKTLTVKKDQLTAEQKAAQERAARQTRFYTNSLVASGRITQKEADDAVEKAKKNASKGVKEDHTLTYSNSAQSNEKVQRVANASKFTNVEVEDKKAKEKAIREARFYTNSQVAAGNMSQKEADKIVKEAGKGHRTTQSANILDKLGGEGEAERQGTRQAGQMNDSKFASGVMQGMSYGDNTRAVGKYNKQAAELVDTVKQSGAFNAGYMTGQGLQFMLGGTGKMTDALVRGVAKNGAMRSALNVGARKGLADMAFEAPMNTLDALKMSTDANGNFDKNSFVKYMALNSGLSGGMGGLIGGVGSKLAKNDAKTFIALSTKANSGASLTEQEVAKLANLQKKFDSIRQGNDVAKTDIVNKADYDAEVGKKVFEKGGTVDDAIKTVNGGSTHTEKIGYANSIKETANAQFEQLRTAREQMLEQAKTASPEEAKTLRQEASKLGSEISRLGEIANTAEKQLSLELKRNKKAVTELTQNVKAMSETTGINYRVVNDKDMKKLISEAGGDVSDDYFYKGFYYKNKNGETEILINSDSPQAHQTVIGHETGHLIKSSNEKEFDDLGNMLEEYAKKNDDFDAVYNQLKRSYPDATEAELREEVTCELLGKYVYGADDTFIKQLAGEKPSVVQRIVEYLKRLFDNTSDKEMAKELQSIIDKTEGLVKNIDSATETKVAKQSKEQKLPKDNSAEARFSKEQVDKSSRLFAPVGKDGMRSKAWEVVANDLKGEKFGAKDLPKMLEGKGVKAEELKWTGLEAFLDGKKSVSKQELQDFFASNTGELHTIKRGNPRTMYDVNRELAKKLAGNRKLYDELYEKAVQWERETDETFERLGVEPYKETPEERARLELSEDPWEAYSNAGYSDEEIEKLTGVKMETFNGKETRYETYMLNGAENYREYEYIMEGNEFQSAHWGEEGVVIHSRIGDFTKAVGEIQERGETHRELRDIFEGGIPAKYDINGYEINFKPYGGAGGGHRVEIYKNDGEIVDTVDFSEIALYRDSELRAVTDDVLSKTGAYSKQESGGRTLYVDEIQSDLHNKGHKYGYEGDEKTISARNEQFQKLDSEREELSEQMTSLNAKRDSLNGSLTQKRNAHLRDVSNEIKRIEDEIGAARERVETKKAEWDALLYKLQTLKDESEIKTYMDEDYPRLDKILEEQTSLQDNLNEISQANKKKLQELRRKRIDQLRQFEEEHAAEYDRLAELEEDMIKLDEKSARLYDAIQEFENNSPVPDSPYKKNYTDYAMKRALREAVENDYEYLAWSTGKIHDERWQGALDYSVEYDTIIPKFMKKYVKQWNGKVEKIRLAENGEEVWGVKITPEMRESVSSQGQYRFSKEAKPKKSLYNYSNEKPEQKISKKVEALQKENDAQIKTMTTSNNADEVAEALAKSDEVEAKIEGLGSTPRRGEQPKTETPKEETPKEAKKTEAQKLSENKYASDEVKTAIKDIEDAGVYKEDAEKVAKKFNDLDKKIAGLQNRLNNAKKKDYPTEAEKTAHIADLEDELKTLRNQQAKAAGKLEQMGKMKAVDDSIDPQDQFHQLRGDTGKVNRELKNADNLKNEDNWIKDKWNSVRRLWEDSLIEVENTAKKVGGELREEILTAANRVRNSQNVANFWITKGRSSFDNKVSGKALDDIFTKELMGNEAKYKDFQEYLIMKHVPARHAKGTDIYPEVSPELADKIVKKLEGKYGKELTDWADDVYGYLKDLQQYRVDSGMLSKEAADKFAKDYPFYVPTNRVNEDEAIDFFTGGLSNQIRTAKGGENDVLDMYSQLYTATNKTIHAAEENEMLNLYFRAKGVTPEQIKGAELPDLEHAVIEANVNKKTGSATVSFFVDGKPVKFPCSHQLALGLRELDGLEFERLMNAAKVSTLYGKPFKALITDWNLVFGVRNGMRDMQQAVVNSKDTRYFGSSFGAAGHAIAHEDSPYRKLYASMGGERAQLVSYDAVAKNLGIEKQGKVDALHEKVQDWVDADIKGKHINPVHYIEGINGAIEMMPRMCEFIGTLRKEANSVLKKQGSSLKKLRKEIIDEVNALEKEGKIGQSEIPAEVENRLANRIIEMVDKDTIDSAMRNANDITLNFGRSGVLGKALNMGFVPYLNPSIQGLSKLVRLFTEAKGEGGWKALASIGMKLGTFTIAPAVWNELALRNNEEYQNLNTRDKDNNFFIALGDGKFIKIPKPRENAVLAEPVEYGLRYFLDKSEYAFFDWDKLKTGDVPLWEKIPLTDEGKQSLRTAVDNIGVINPMTSNMVSPLWQTFHNKTWYGGSIESAYETAINEDTGKANVPVNKRYDTGTSGVAIWLGQSKVAKELNLSPKKIDNILDSYTGMIYDLGISQTTEEAKTRGNYLLRTAASQFLKDSVFSNKLSTKAWEKIDGMSKKEQDEYKSKYMYDAYKYDDAMDAITADKNMTVKEKMEAKRFLQKQRNKLYRAAINGEENTTNPLKDISKYLGANKTLNKFLPKSGDEQYDNWTDYYKNYKKTKGYKNLTPAQKEKEAQKFLDVYTLGVKGQSKVSGDFHDAPSWGMTGVAAAQRYKQGKLSQKDAETIMQSCGVYESQTASYFKYADHGGNVSRYAVTKKNNNKAEDLANELGVSTKGDGSIWKNKYSKEKGIKGGVLSMSLATGKADFKDRAYYISNSGDSNMLIKMNAARGYAEKYGHTTKQLIKLGKKADADGNTYLSNEEIESACQTIKKGKATSEEKAMAWVLLGGNPNKNPFGSIGNYSHDGDTGITMDDDGKSGGGGGRRGRGRRGRGGGGGGSKKGTMPKTESGAIKGKVTDVFATSNGSKASNLNDAYRKKVRKLRKELR